MDFSIFSKSSPPWATMAFFSWHHCSPAPESSHIWCDLFPYSLILLVCKDTRQRRKGWVRNRNKFQVNPPNRLGPIPKMHLFKSIPSKPSPHGSFTPPNGPYPWMPHPWVPSILTKEVNRPFQKEYPCMLTKARSYYLHIILLRPPQLDF